MATWPNGCECNSLKPHIIGRAFSLVLTGEAGESPVSEGGVPVVDTSTWGVALNLVAPSGGASITIAGTWVSAVAPHAMKFEVNDTSAWPRGERMVRLIFTAPDARTFEEPTNMILEIIR